MNERFIDEIFSNVTNSDYIRVGWEDPADNFKYDSFTNISDFDKYVSSLKTNPDAISIYFSPNPSYSPSYRDDPHLIKLNWLFIDIDQINRAELDSRLNDFEAKYNLKPTFVVCSGKGFHLYWRLSDQWTPDEWELIQGGIRKFFGADHNVATVERLLRIPGTENRKCLIPKKRDKGYLEPYLCEVVMHNPVRYTRTDFDVLGIMQPADKNTTRRVNLGAKFKPGDIDKVRKHCNPLEKVFLDIENGSAQGDVGHKQRIVAANFIKNTVNDEKYFLEKFKNLHDFDEGKSLKHYKSLDQPPITCIKMQEWGLCREKCQLMKDIEMKSPIAFASRKGVALDTSEQLIRNLDTTGERTDEFNELLKRIKIMQNPLKANNLKNEVMRMTNLKASDLNAALRDFQAIDSEKPYLVNGSLNVMKAAEYMVDELNIIHYQGEPYQYEDGIWKKKSQAWLEAQIHHRLKNDAGTGTISQVIQTVIRESFLAPEDVDYEQSKNMIAAANGLFDITSSNFRPFVPDDFVFRKLQVDYNPDASAPEFEKFLTELFTGDKDSDDKMKALQELSGYILIADYSLLKLMFYFYGPSANNGKSTFLEIVQAMLGNDMYTSIPLDQLQGSMLSHLHGKHVNVVGDLNADTKVPDGILKQLVGGKDLITADRKYLSPIQFFNTARLIYAVNRLPFSQAKDKGYYTRVAVISFNNEFVLNPDKYNNRQFKADPKRIQKILSDELSGVLNWSLEGLKRFLANGEMTLPASSREIVAKYQIENNSVMSFVDECCDLKPGPPVNRTNIYKAYENWCKVSGIRHKVNAATFYKMLEDEYCIVTERTEDSRNLTGISLNDNYRSNYRIIHDRNVNVFA